MHPNHNKFICADEAACDGKDLWRIFGYSPEGEACCQLGDLKRGTRYSVLIFLSYEGLRDVVVKERGFKADDTLTVVRHMGKNGLLQAGETLLWDNCNIHHDFRVTDVLRHYGVNVEFTPPYAPEWQPCENFFAFMKGDLKRRPEKYDQLEEKYGRAFAIRMAAVNVPQRHAASWFRNCGPIVV